MSIFSLSKDVNSSNFIFIFFLLLFVFSVDFGLFFYGYHQILYGTLISLVSLILFSISIVLYFIKKSSLENFNKLDYNKKISIFFIIYSLIFSILVYFTFINSAFVYLYVVGYLLLPITMICVSKLS